MNGARARARSIAAALLIGALTTLAISWTAMFLPTGNAWNGPPTGEDLGVCAGDDGKLWTISRGRNAWHTVVSYWHMQVSGMSIMIPAADYEAREYDFLTLPRSLRPGSLEDLNIWAWYHETGWPLRAMTCSVHWERQIANENVTYTVRGGAQLPRDAAYNPRALPLTPVWGGLVANTALFACAWLGLAAAVGAVRRRARRRCGRCASCGYPREGLPEEAACPECGGAAGPRGGR